jgi:hypothetical protein
MGSATVASSMADDKHKGKSAPSRLMKGFGAVTPRQKPEDWRKVREEMEAAMAKEVNDDKE